MEELKAAITTTGETVDAYLTRKYSNGKWRVEEVFYIYAYQLTGLSNATEYRWRSDEQGLYTISGKTQNLTPQFDSRGLEVTEARSKIKPHELAIYERWNDLLAENDNQEEVTRLVAEEFEITEDEVATVYQPVAECLV